MIGVIDLLNKNMSEVNFAATLPATNTSGKALYDFATTTGRFKTETIYGGDEPKILTYKNNEFIKIELGAETVYYTGTPEKIEFDKKKTTKVTFSDGTVQTVKLQYGDEFNERMGIALALIFHRFGGKKEFYKALDGAMKILDQQRKAEEEALQEKREAERKREKAAKRKAKLRAKREERQIEIQKEAYKRALKEYINGE